MTETPRMVLIIDDHPGIREFLAQLVQLAGFASLTAEHGAHALELLAQDRPDLIFVDYEMPIMNGAAFAVAYAETPPPHAPLVLITAHHKEELDWPGPPPVAMLPKPVPVASLQILLQQYLHP